MKSDTQPSYSLVVRVKFLTVRVRKPRQCPACGQQGSVCHRLNHFAKVCNHNILHRSILRKRYMLQESHKSENETTLYMDPLQINGLAGQSWLSTISTSSSDMTFKLDTGAEASVIPTKLYNKLRKSLY